MARRKVFVSFDYDHEFAARRDVTPLHDIERALAAPMKHFERPMLDFLTRP